MTTAQPRGESARIFWSHPQTPDSPLNDCLIARLDFYGSSIQLTSYDEGVPQATWPVSPADLARTITANTRVNTGLLPDTALWKTLTPAGPPKIALWTPPSVRKVAVAVEFNKPTQRYELPMPGLVFVCCPSAPPAVYAAKRRPAHEEEPLYNAPVFNTYPDGTTCQGTHSYPEDISLMPEQFFTAWFTTHGNQSRRSKKHPDSLLSLWEELDGTEEYPLDDLTRWGTVAEAMAL